MANWKNKAETKLEKFIEDIATLEVVTLSGKLTVKDLEIQDNGNINFEKIMDRLKGTPAQSSKINVVAATKIALDKDVQQFVKEGMNTEEQTLFNLHTDSIQQALTARKATFEMLLSIVKGG